MANSVTPFPGKPQNNSGVASGGSGPHDPSMEARVAVLEQIAKQTNETLGAIRTDLAGIRADLKTDLTAVRTEARTGLDATRDRQDRDFRLIFGAIISAFLGLAGMILGLAGVMAKGFKWF